MMKKEMKKKNNKGFSLVEIIVVLVIMAILVAVSIPALTGYIDEAKGKGNLTEARTAYISCQAAISEFGNPGTKLDGYKLADTPATDNVFTTRVKKLMKDSYSADAQIVEVKTSETDGCKISSLKYSVNGYTITLKAGESATIEKNAK